MLASGPFALHPGSPTQWRGFFSEVGFRANPVLFSCYACLFADAGVIKYTAEQIEGSQQRLKKALREYRAKHGIWPHPAILLRGVLAGPEDQGASSLAKAD